MPYSTVIFDLYLTLVHGYSYTEHEQLVSKMAGILQAPDPPAFARLFSHETWPERGTGRLPTIQANIEPRMSTTRSHQVVATEDHSGSQCRL